MNESDRETKIVSRLEEQIDWYDRRSKSNQHWYKCLKIVAMFLTGSVPVLAALGFSAVVAGVLSAVVLFFEGLQQLYQFHANWISYRSTCESLKHEKHLFAGRAGHYRNVEDPYVLLAEQTESLVSVEHAKWADNTRDVEKKTETKG